MWNTVAYICIKKKLTYDRTYPNLMNKYTHKGGSSVTYVSACIFDRCVPMRVYASANVQRCMGTLKSKSRQVAGDRMTPARHLIRPSRLIPWRSPRHCMLVSARKWNVCLVKSGGSLFKLACSARENVRASCLLLVGECDVLFLSYLSRSAGHGPRLGQQCWNGVWYVRILVNQITTPGH